MSKHIINNKGGRPKLAPHKKCTVSLSLRIPSTLDAYITEQARDKYHGKRNDYIRAVLRGQWVKELVSPEFNKILHDISNLGNNVKYMRDWFYSHGYDSKQQECDVLLQELSVILAKARHHREIETNNSEKQIQQENRSL